MYKNKTKEKLKNNQAVFGYICNIPAASISEIAGQANLDFIVIDCEHGPMNEADDQCTRCGAKNSQYADQEITGWEDEDEMEGVEEIW